MREKTLSPARPAHAGRIVTLQYLRAVAALMVVAYHASHYLAFYRKPSAPIDIWESTLGMWGVALFFALSGYLMARLAPVTPPGRFLLHRIARIYPLYFIVLAAFFLLSPLIIGFWLSPRFLPSTLVPVGPAGYALGVEWTLLYEITFYVLIFLVMLAGQARAIPGLALAWIAAIVGWRLFIGDQGTLATPTIDQLPLSTANVAFACGLLVPTVMQRLRIHPAWMLAGLLMLALDAARVTPSDRIIAGAMSALIVAAAIAAPQRGLPGVTGRIALRLGDASYAIYLVHVPVLVTVFGWLPAGVPLAAAWCLALAGAVLVGLGFGVADIRIYRWLKLRIDALAEPRALRLSGLYVGFFIAIAGWAAVSNAIDAAQSARAGEPLQLVSSGGVLIGDPTPDAINARLAAADKAFGAPRGAIDQVQRLPEDKVAVQGWAIDLDRPAARTWVAVYCDGRQAAWAERTRLRRAQAAELGSKALAKIRFGFTLATQSGACPTGARMTMIAADADGRAHALPITTSP